MAAIELSEVCKSFQNQDVIHGINLKIRDGALTVIVGPSGCGKSTLLRMIAGLEDVTSGEIRVDGERCEHLVPAARGMAMVFQSYALYPHMTVEKNLRFGLENLKTPEAEIVARITRAAEVLQITELLQRHPRQLSGGQNQRVAIGRAIVKEPKAFLFDEPLSNLDTELRVKMRNELVKLHRRLGTTMIYVTHDQTEAMTMADEIVVLRQGRVEQVGAPIELYARPRNKFVASFLGAPQMNMLSGVFVRKNTKVGVLLGGGIFIATWTPQNGPTDGEAVTLGMRPEHIKIGNGATDVTVINTEILGSESILHAELEGGQSITIAQRGITNTKTGDKLTVDFPIPFTHIFDADDNAVPQKPNWHEDYVQ